MCLFTLSGPSRGGRVAGHTGQVPPEVGASPVASAPRKARTSVTSKGCGQGATLTCEPPHGCFSGVFRMLRLRFPSNTTYKAAAYRWPESSFVALS